MDIGVPAARRRRRGARLGWIVACVVVGVAALPAAALLAAGWIYEPPAHVSLRIAGLSAAVDITLDGRGIPHIKAASETDAATAIGYLHARDRMFQMDLMRRAASGRLAEIAGPAALPLDRMARLLGEKRHADRSYAALPDDTRAMLVAYASGVNAWIDARGRLSGIEFALLGAPERWRPEDCLLWSETVTLWLSDNYRTELARSALEGRLGLQRVLQLWPTQQIVGGLAPAGPAAAPVERRPAEPGAVLRQGLLDALPQFPAPFTLPDEASNAWAVDGRHSATGAPLLAGDPHLRLGFPSLWYLARIETPGNTLVGATAPGVPFLVLGRNRHIAWSFTASGIDTQDVYVETELPGGFYAAPGGKLPFTVRDERIRVRGGPDEILHVRSTRHGPVISDLDAVAGTVGPVLAVAMAGLEAGSPAPGILALDRAASVAEAGRAAVLVTAPVQNLTVADNAGVGIFTTGLVPVRRAGDGAMPVPGADGAHDWTGFASGDALPHVVSANGDAGSGIVANANDRTAGPDFPTYLGRDWPAPFRDRRIHELLDGKSRLTLDDFEAMQRDPVSVFAHDVLPMLRSLPRQEGVTGEAQALLVDWDGTMDAARPEPLIFNAAMQLFVKRALANAGVPEQDGGPWSGFAAWLLTPEGDGWCAGECRALLPGVLGNATRELAARFGADPRRWRWGAAHVAVFAHPLLGELPLIGRLASRRVPVSGDDSTLFRGGSGALGDFASRHGAAFRGIYDLGNLERSRFVVTPGQSGNFLAAHAWDMLADWARGATIPISATPDRVAGTVRLDP